MKKNEIIKILVILSIFILITFILFIATYNQKPDNKPENNNHHNNNEVQNFKSSYLIVNDTNMWEYHNKKWTNKKNFDTNNNKLSVYVNKKYSGYYNMEYIKSWNLFDDNDNFIEYEGNILAFTNDLNINVKDYGMNKVDNEDIKKINEIMSTSITGNELTTNEKIIIDLNKDGIDDSIINVSNIELENANIYFSLIYAIINNDIKIIKKDIIPVTDLLIVPNYNLEYVLNINNEDIDSIVIREGYFSLAGETNCIMYQFINGSYQKVV